MAGELRQYAEGLALAAPNGLEAPAPTATSMSDGTATTMSDPAPSRLSVAQLMGVDQRPSAVTAVTSVSSDGSIDFTQMAADDVFEMVSQVCSSCHAQFRSGS